MVRKRKVGEGEEISCNSEMGTINEAAQQTRKRFVGVRQRPSGRWVAEIKDTIQHIRVWLGTFDSTEEAAKAYDEAACLLRGANTRTNFWPSSYTPSALSSKITNLILHRLSERNSSGDACVQNHPQFEGTTETQDTESFDHYFDDIPYITPRVNSTDTLTNYSSTSEYVSASSESNLTNNQGCDGVRDIDFGDNWTSSNDLLLVGDDCKVEEELEEVNMGIMDLQFVDEVGLSLHYSPFEIAEEMAEPIEQGDDPCLLTEAMKRMKYERTFSASFYAFNGISECLRLKLQYSGSGDDMGNQK